MSEADKIELRSEEVKDILSQVPNSLIRWGSTGILFVIISVILVCWFVKYPDLIKGNIELISQNPPITLIGKMSGKLVKLNYPNAADVPKNAIIASFESNANAEDINSFNQLFSTVNLQMIENSRIPFDRNWNLGEIQIEYFNLLNAIEEYNLFKSNSFEYKTIQHIEKQIENVKSIGKVVSSQELNRLQEISILKDKLKKDRELFNKGIISQRELNVTEAQYLEAKSNYENFTLTNQNNDGKIQDFKKQINDNKITFLDKRTQKITALSNAYNALFQKYESWKNNYLIIAPYDGKINYLDNWKTNQFVNTSTELFSIVPGGTTDTVLRGAMLVPIQGIGKIKRGQRVNIQLFNYPNKEFGILIGEVNQISQVPNKDKKYLLSVVLKNGLTTTYQKKLDFAEQMQGNAEVVTDEKRILERIFENVFDLIRNR